MSGGLPSWRLEPINRCLCKASVWAPLSREGNGTLPQECQGPLVSPGQGVGSAGFPEAESGPWTNLRLRKPERPLSCLGRAAGTFPVSAPTSVPLPWSVPSAATPDALFVRAWRLESPQKFAERFDLLLGLHRLTPSKAFFFFFLLVLEEAGREKHGRERETWSVASLTCPDWGSNPPHFGAWSDTPAN